MTKHKDCIKIFKKNGWWLSRHGANHDVYTNGKNSEPLPRHSEINNLTWKGIVKRNHLKE